MKKRLSVFLSIVILFVLTACDKQKDPVLAAGADISIWVQAVENEEIQMYSTGVWFEYNNYLFGGSSTGSQSAEIVNFLQSVTYSVSDKTITEIDKTIPLFSVGLHNIDYESGERIEEDFVRIWFAEDGKYAFAAKRSESAAQIFEVSDPQTVLDFFMNFEDNDGTYQAKLKQFNIK